MDKNRKILAGLVTAAVIMPAVPGTVQAAQYHADTDTGVQALDYIENQHRAERENRLTEEQVKLLQDAKEMEKHLRHPLDKTKPVPIAFEGEDLTYDERDGSFIAKGKVDILQLDAHRFQGEEITGNTRTQDIHVPDKAHILQMTPGQMRVTLDGYKASYNYGKKTGSMEDGRGKAGHHYITGKRFEFYPNKMVVYNGTDTKCGAEKPDYQMRAEKMTIIPNDKIILENMSFWIKGTKIFSRKHYENKLDGSKDETSYLPRVGYDSDNGVSLSWDLEQPVAKNIKLHEEIKINTKQGWRSNYDLIWRSHHMSTGIRYGHYEDSDNKWIKKQPSFFWSYGDHIGRSHFYYSLNTEYGRWYNDGIHSTHKYYGTRLSYDPIKFHRYTLYLSSGYGITTESYDDSRVAGMTFDSVLTKDFNERWAAYTGYHYNKNTTKNSVFDFNNDDFAKKLEMGFSYRMTDRDRFVIGSRYDMDADKWADIDYYWYHDMHCSQVILRYRSLSNQWKVSWQFTPW